MNAVAQSERPQLQPVIKFRREGFNSIWFQTQIPSAVWDFLKIWDFCETVLLIKQIILLVFRKSIETFKNSL